MSLEMPYDQDLETLLIGNVLLNKRMTVEDKTVSVVDFYSTVNQRIWQVFCELDEDDEPIEILEVHRRVGMNVRVSDLADMTRGLSVVGNIRLEDVKALKDLATLRNLIRTYAKLARMAEKKESVESILAENGSMMESVASEQDRRHGTSQHLIEVMEYEVFPRLDKFVSGDLVKIPFGFDKLDMATNGGASLGELVVLGAKPKSGKSVMMLQMARYIASLQIPTLIASLEMLNYENGFRFLAQSSDYSVNIFQGNMHELTAHKLKEHAKEHYKLPLRFDQKARTTKQLGLEIQRLKDSEGLTAVFVDYVQMIRNEKKSLGRVERIEEAIYDLKELAMKHEIVVYTAAQFNREGIKSDRPTLADFDGASAIEKTANLGLFWTLEKDYDYEIQGRKGNLWIELGRSVAADEFSGLIFHGKDARFSLN